ncbi:hypothetical protein CLF_105513, partial [Clonorchis sinensis]
VVERFTCLGSCTSSRCSVTDEVSERISRIRVVFQRPIAAKRFVDLLIHGISYRMFVSEFAQVVSKKSNLSAVVKVTTQSLFYLTVVLVHGRFMERSTYVLVDSSSSDFIAECTDYNSALTLLGKPCIHPKNIVYARHLYKPGQDADQFVQQLKLFAKDCVFKAVSAVEHTNGVVRDVLIIGLQSHSIREKPLTWHELDLDKAHEASRALGLARKQSRSYIHGQSGACSMPTLSSSVNDETTFSAAKQQTCYSRNTLICERLTWNPAESPVFGVSRRLNVLHQASSCSSCYDIRDIAIHVYT